MNHNEALRLIETFRVVDPEIAGSFIAFFLYVASNEGCLISEAARALGMSKSTSSRTFHALAERRVKQSKTDGKSKTGRGVKEPLDLLTSEPDPVDMRMKHLHLTEKGRRLMYQIREI